MIELGDCAGILFDMDGVLLDTEPLYTVAYDAMLAPYGANLDLETKLQIMGRPAIFSAGFVIEKFGIPKTPEAFLEERKPVLEELFKNAPAVPGAKEFILRLKESGHKIAVATSTGRRLFELKTQQHEWFQLFDAVICGDDPELKASKPAPDIFLLAAKRLGISATDAIVFEDSPTGVIAGMASGARVVMLTTVGADAQLSEAPWRVISGYDEIGI